MKEIISGSSEMTEEHIEKHDKVINSLENKRKMVMDFIAKGEKLMEDANCPKFLDGHVKKLREAWEDTTDKSQVRKKALADNFSSWEIFETQKVENHKHLDLAGDNMVHVDQSPFTPFSFLQTLNLRASKRFST